jgi:glycosyltransferase involved in cell wall biosynthesis
LGDRGEPMKIAYLLTLSDSIGGAAIHVRDMASAIQARGHDVTVMVGGNGMLVDLLRERNLRVVSISSLRRALSIVGDLAAYQEIKSTLRQLRPDLVSIHSSKAGILGRMAGASLGIPAVFTVHGWSFTDGLPLRQRYPAVLAERFAARYGRLIITVSNHDRELAVRYSIDRPERIVAIQNGMPDNPAAMRAHPGALAPRLIMVARFQPQKDHATLLSALAELRQYSWALDLVGDGPGRSAVESLLHTLGLEDRVRVLGYSNDVAKLLSESDLFVLTSKWEGLPLSILEAMRAGLPVIATDVGGVSESVDHGVTGFVVQRSSVSALKEALHPLLTSAELRRAMGARGRARYEECFTFERMVERTLQAYERTLTDHRGVPADAS